MTDEWKSYVDLDGTHVHVAANLPTTVDELIERHGIRPGLLVATAPEAALLTELLAEAWHAADFAARHELVPRVAALQAERDEARARLRARELYGPRDND